MNKELKITLGAAYKHGNWMYEREIIAHSTYDLLQKCLKWCIEFSKDPKVVHLVFVDQEGTVQSCDAQFFRDGKFKQ